MVIIRFNQWEEFLAEMRESPPEDRTVRLTFSLRYDGRGVPHLTMVAGYRSRAGIVEFVHYLGLQPVDRTGQRAREIETSLNERRRLLEELGFRVRSGRYHVPPTLAR